MVINPVDLAFSDVMSVINIMRVSATGRADMINHNRVLSNIAEARLKLDALETATLADQKQKIKETADKQSARVAEEKRLSLYLLAHPEEADRAARLSKVNLNRVEITF
jgi:hypothetical protein